MHTTSGRGYERGKKYAIAAYQDLRRALEVKQGEREKLGSFRPAGAVIASISAAQQDWRWQATVSCTDTGNRDRRSFCEGYRRLEAELATARRADKLDAELDALRRQIAAAPERAASAESDPQMALLKQLSGLAEDYVRLALTVLVSIMVELGSGLGLYVVFGHGHVAARQWPASPRKAAATTSNEEDWRKQRLVDDEQGHAGELALYRDYCRWLVEQERGPSLTLGDFREWLVRERIGTPVRKAGRNYLVGVR
ncbi:MAG: hypothetical protein AB7O64_19515, partial [Methylibium sp.]